MMEGLLIELVKGYPALYDINHEEYARTKTKIEIWKKIAKELNYPSGSAAKDQWRRLRDCHRDAIRRQMRRTNEGSSTKPWTHQKEMEFLLPFMNIRSIQCWEESASDTTLQALPEEVDVLEDDLSSSTVQDSFEAADKRQPQSASCSLLKPDMRSLMQATLEHLKEWSQERNVSQKRKYEDSSKDDVEKNDSLYQFFMSMYNTTKKFPMFQQLQVKKKIFAAVTEAEEQLTAQHQ